MWIVVVNDYFECCGLGEFHVALIFADGVVSEGFHLRLAGHMSCNATLALDRCQNWQKPPVTISTVAMVQHQMRRVCRPVGYNHRDLLVV